MIKTLHNVLKRDRERFTIPKTVQDIIPVKTIWNDGIFKVGNLFSKTFQFSDINYAMLSAEDTKDLFLKYSDVINSFEYGATYKLTIALERYNQKALQESVLMPMREDELDRLRKESNARITHDAMSAGNFRHLRYLTVSAYKKDIKEARAYFNRIASELSSTLSRLGSHCEELDTTDKLVLLHNFFRPNEKTTFFFDAVDMAKKGMILRTISAPTRLNTKKTTSKLAKNMGALCISKITPTISRTT